MLRLLIVFLVLVGCQSNQKVEPYEVIDASDSEGIKDKQSLWSDLKIDTLKAKKEESDEYLFGKFYNDRIAFHIIDDPKLVVHNAMVNQLTLYYIDGLLCKKQYKLDRGIADELAMRYGAVTYKSLNHSTDSIARDMGIVLASINGNRFNPYLKKYQLKWALDDKFVYFRHLEDSTSIANVYIEELAEYRTLFRSVQKEML